MPVIGLVAPASAGQVEIIEALRQGLKEADFVESQNVTIQSAFAEGQFDLLPGLAELLVRRQVVVITALRPQLRRSGRPPRYPLSSTWARTRSVSV
jgi:hypothetical protein